MTTLKPEIEVATMMRERAFVMSRALPREEIEMEARLGVKPGRGGTDRLFWINAYKYVRERAERKTWSNYTHRVYSDGLVYSFRERDGNWTLKKEIRSVVLSNNWAKIALSTEAPSHNPTLLSEANALGDKSKITIRHIARHSFYIGKSRVDFTKSYTNDELTHEVEIEYLAPLGTRHTPEMEARYRQAQKTEEYTDTYKQFLLEEIDPEEVTTYVELMRNITAAMFQTPLPFTYEELITVSAICNHMLARTYETGTPSTTQYLNRTYLSEARTMRIGELNYTSLFKGGRTWNVCLKTDGERRVLVICDQGTWLLFPPLQAALISRMEAHLNTRLTVADVEFYRGEIWLLDVLWVNGTDERGTRSHLVRYDKFRDWQQREAHPDLFQGLTVRYKTHNIITGSDFFIKVHDMWHSRHKCGYKVDGLIFTPDGAYQEGTNLDNRIIIKWKPEITIDLQVGRDNRGNLVVFGYSEDKTLEQFTGTESSPLLGIDMGEIQYDRDSIVEFECREGKLLAVRDRAEKTGPNRYDHAIESWLSATIDTRSVGIDTLLGSNNVLMRKYHNRVKSRLYERVTSEERDLILLDIGSGRGGDISKWEKAGFSKILCIEPDKDNIRELEMRLKTMSAEFRARVYVLNARGEDSTLIKNFATKNGIDRVHVVSMMDTLTYFFDSKRRSLAALAKTVNSLLPDGGYFIWRCLDGAAVRTAFDISGEESLPYGDSRITLLDSTRVQVDIPPNQMGIVEYLTDIRELKTALDLSGEVEIAQEEALLTPPYIALSRLYTHGVFVKGKKLVPTSEMVEVFKYTTLKKMSKPEGTPVYSKSIIGAIEATFSSARHSTLISEYIYVANQKDYKYNVIGTEPVFFKFETAYLGFFAYKFLEKNKIDPYVLEDEVIRDADPNDEATSLAFASLLSLDVFVIDADENLIWTNAIKGRDTNPCCVVLSNEGGYRLLPFSSGYPLALSTDSTILAYEDYRNASDDLHGATVDSVGVGVDLGALFSVNKRPSTNVLNRIAHIESASPEARFLSLANRLLNSASTGCTQADLESCGIGGNYPSLIQYVNEKMKRMREAR